MFARAWRGRRIVGCMVSLLGCAALAACGGGLGSSGESNPKVYGLYDRIPEGGGVYKVGKPYRVAGQWFYPQEDPAYDQVGVASWYGEYFHGRHTANGEFYDMNRMSAAHPTLPLPTYARVTNLENGRSLVVRVNDRGPFKRGRIIDLSKGAADELGVIANGTAQVRVTYLADAPLEGDIAQMQQIDQGLGGRSPTRFASVPPPPALAASTAPLPPAPRPAVAPRPAPPVVPSWTLKPQARAPQSGDPKGFVVQAAAFRSEASARSLAEELAHLGVFDVLPVEVGGGLFYRVRTGPLGSRADAERAAADIAAAGVDGARILAE